MDLVCYYGAKPDFIKDPGLGKEELERVKAKVALCASRKRADFRKRAREDAASASQVPRAGVGTGMMMAMEGSDTPGSLASPPISVAPPTLIPEQTILFSHGIGDQEARLIMHYFDHVFYIQFRFHTPTLSAGGRGWLLSLLTRTKPLYHAALSLSAFHQQSLMALARGEEETDYLQELERQHNLTLKELQLSIQAHSLDQSEAGAFDRNVQILACTVQLISFEVCPS
jgi:C6 transcription factor Pro1